MEMPDWNEYQDARREMERLIDRQRGAGFRLGQWLPVEQKDWHHEAIQHLREIDHLMNKMYSRGLEEQAKQAKATANQN